MFNQFFREIDSFPFLGRRIYNQILYSLFSIIFIISNLILLWKLPKHTFTSISEKKPIIAHWHFLDISSYKSSLYSKNTLQLPCNTLITNKINKNHFNCVKMHISMGSTWQFMFGICQNFAAENLTLYAMNLITIEESAWKALMEQLQSIENQLKQEPIEWDSLWLNQKEICQYLHLSEKTLWRMRKRNEITYSKIYGQYFYTLGSIRKLLISQSVENTESYLQSLTQKAKGYVEKARYFK